MPLEIRGAHFNSECTISAGKTLRIGPAKALRRVRCYRPPTMPYIAPKRIRRSLLVPAVRSIAPTALENCWHLRGARRRALS